MPTYSYHCDECNYCFELFSYIRDYKPNPECPKCLSQKTNRQYVADAMTLMTSVKKSDSELKTLGDLALRNSEKMSDDQKHDLYMKHNSYKEDSDSKPLPSGMSRVKKPPKIKWPGSQPKTKRKKNI